MCRLAPRPGTVFRIITLATALEQNTPLCTLLSARTSPTRAPGSKNRSCCPPAPYPRSDFARGRAFAAYGKDYRACSMAARPDALSPESDESARRHQPDLRRARAGVGSGRPHPAGPARHRVDPPRSLSAPAGGRNRRPPRPPDAAQGLAPRPASGLTTPTTTDAQPGDEAVSAAGRARPPASRSGAHAIRARRGAVSSRPPPRSRAGPPARRAAGERAPDRTWPAAAAG